MFGVIFMLFGVVCVNGVVWFVVIILVMMLIFFCLGMVLFLYFIFGVDVLWISFLVSFFVLMLLVIVYY